MTPIDYCQKQIVAPPVVSFGDILVEHFRKKRNNRKSLYLYPKKKEL
jgi:hypothetical protein